VVHRRVFADDCRPIGSDAARSVDPIRASGRVALLGQSKNASRNHDGERDAFDFDLDHHIQ
jgi:hypothetical protein